MVFVSLAAISLVYAYVCEIRQDIGYHRLRDWVEENHPDAWATLNAVHRHALGGRIGLRALHRGPLAHDPAFSDRYLPISRMERRKLQGMAVGAIAIGMTIVGTMFWGWAW